MRDMVIDFFPVTASGAELDQDKIYKEDDLISSVNAYAFCLYERIQYERPDLAEKFKIRHADIAFVDSYRSAVVRFFAVIDPWELGLSVNDALLSIPWNTHPNEQYGWYPDDEEDESFIAVLRRVSSDIEAIQLRPYGDLAVWARGTRAMIRNEYLLKGSHAKDMMVGINKIYDTLNMEVK